MSKYVKGLVQSELEQRIAGRNISEFIVISMMGVNGIENNRMRGEFKAKGIHMLMIKNSLFKRALQNCDMERACDIFDGPCTIAYGGDSIVDVAKGLSEWCDKVGQMEFKAAFLEGSVLDAQGTKALSKMLTRSELLGQVVLLAQSPGRQLMSAVNSGGSIIAGCLKAIIAKREESGEQAA